MSLSNPQRKTKSHGVRSGKRSSHGRRLSSPSVACTHVEEFDSEILKYSCENWGYQLTMNCLFHLQMLFWSDASCKNRPQYARCTVSINLDTSNRSKEHAFSYWLAILETAASCSCSESIWNLLFEGLNLLRWWQNKPWLRQDIYFITLTMCKWITEIESTELLILAYECYCTKYTFLLNVKLYWNYQSKL